MRGGEKIFKSLTKLFEPQRKFVYDGKLPHQSQIPIYIGFSLSDTLNELPVLLTAAQIILWCLQLSHQQNFETFLVQHHLHAQSSQISSLDPKFYANCNFCCGVLLFILGINSRTSRGENPPFWSSVLQLEHPGMLLLPSQQPGNVGMELRRSHLPAQGGGTQIMTLSSTAFMLLFYFYKQN